MGFPGAGGVQLIKELEYVLINHVGHLGFRIKSFSIYVFDPRFLLPHPILKSQRIMEVPFQLQFLPLPISFFSCCSLRFFLSLASFLFFLFFFLAFFVSSRTMC